MNKSILYNKIFPTDVRISLLSQTRKAENVVTNQTEIDARVKHDILVHYNLTATIENQQQRSSSIAVQLMKCGQGFLSHIYRMLLKHAMRRRFSTTKSSSKSMK
jgi:hypothetical protein